MKRSPFWATLTVASLPAMAAFIQCGAQGSQGLLPSINMVVKPSADVVFRAKLQACTTDTDCTRAIVTPRCALNSVTQVHCDITDAGGQPTPPGKGICSFAIPVGDSRCNCFEGDIRYCDLNNWNSCTRESPGSCGIQMCTKGPEGLDPSSIPPGPAWGPCQPQVAPPIADAGADAMSVPVLLRNPARRP